MFPLILEFRKKKLNLNGVAKIKGYTLGTDSCLCYLFVLTEDDQRGCLETNCQPDGDLLMGSHLMGVGKRTGRQIRM